MYIKFLIGSIIFALVCFGIGYRVCWLKKEKERKGLMSLYKMCQDNYDDLLREYKAQVIRLNRRLNTEDDGR